MVGTRDSAATTATCQARTLGAVLEGSIYSLAEVVEAKHTSKGHCCDARAMDVTHPHNGAQTQLVPCCKLICTHRTQCRQGMTSTGSCLVCRLAWWDGTGMRPGRGMLYAVLDTCSGFGKHEARTGNFRNCRPNQAPLDTYNICRAAPEHTQYSQTQSIPFSRESKQKQQAK